MVGRRRGRGRGRGRDVAWPTRIDREGCVLLLSVYHTEKIDGNDDGGRSTV